MKSFWCLKEERVGVISFQKVDTVSNEKKTHVQNEEEKNGTTRPVAKALGENLFAGLAFSFYLSRILPCFSLPHRFARLIKSRKCYVLS
jgi:hypothetical protein